MEKMLFYFISTAVMIVLGILGWALKRNIGSIDKSIKTMNEAIQEIKSNNQKMELEINTKFVTKDDYRADKEEWGQHSTRLARIETKLDMKSEA